MASGGDVGGSEDYTLSGLLGHLCSTCCNDKSTEASHYCPECDTCYCKACLCDHTVIGRAGIQNWGKPQSSHSEQEKVQKTEYKPGVGREKCLHHTDMDVEFFCQDHDVVCCKMCFFTDHRHCSTKESIGHVFDDITSIEEDMNFARETMAGFTNMLKYAQSEKKLREKSIETSHKKYIEQVEVYRAKMNTVFDNILEGSYAKRKHTLSKFETDRMLCQTMQKEVPRFKEMLHDSDDIKVKFIRMKICKEWLRKNELVLKEIRSVAKDKEDGECFELIPNSDIESTLTSVKNLVDIKLGRPRYDVRIIGDEKTCEVVGACELADGRIVITDTANKCLKVLDEDMSVVNSYKFTNAPVGICLINGTDVAVGMDNKTVDILSIAENVDVLRTLKLDRDCSHLAFSNNKLHIAVCHKCGSEKQRYCCCSISIYKYNVLTGEEEGTLSIDKKPNHRYARTSTLPLAFSTDASQIYIACHGYDFFLLCDNDGKNLGSANPYEFSPCTSMCCDDSVNAYCSYSDMLGTVYKFDTTNVSNIRHTRKASFSDGIPSPLSMAWHRNVGRVIIGGKSDNLYMI